MDLNIFQQQIL
jgi:hypothetical protein